MKLLAIALCLTSFAAFAEIKEIPPEEMTESYIRDTTVIVPKAQTSETQSNAQVKIAPNEVPSNAQKLQQQGTKAASPKPQLGNSYLPEQRERQLHDNELRAQSQQPLYSIEQKNRDDNLRNVLKTNNINFATLGVPESGPIDYSKLQFPSQTGSSSQGNIVSSPNQFIISIPNSNGYRASNQSAPGGEYQIKVDNNNIQLIINRPQK